MTANNNKKVIEPNYRTGGVGCLFLFYKELVFFFSPVPGWWWREARRSRPLSRKKARKASLLFHPCSTAHSLTVHTTAGMQVYLHMLERYIHTHTHRVSGPIFKKKITKGAETCTIIRLPSTIY